MTHAGGRPLNFATPNDLETVFLEWRSTFDRGGDRENEYPDVEGFCDYINSYRNMLNEYESKEEFSGTIKRIKNWIYFKKKQAAAANKMPVALFIFDAVNNAGYSNKTETDITSKGEQIATVDPLAAAEYANFLKSKQ